MRWSNAVVTVPNLAEHEIHVWQVSLNLSDTDLALAWQWLDPSERERARRYRFEPDRRRFVAGRGQLRTLLGRYLAVSPGALSFSYNTYGKPRLARSGAEGLHFNVAHAADRALFALCRVSPIGIDLECIQPAVDLSNLAQIYFAPEERAALQTLDSETQIQAFFRFWSCKEAYVKALGQGFSLPMCSFAIALGPASPRLLYSHDRAPANWQLYEPNIGSGFTAALAVARQGLQLCYSDSY